MIDIDDCLEPVSVNGTTYRIDLIATAVAMNEILERHKGKTNFEYVADFAAYMKATYQMDLRTGQADRLWSQLNLMVLREKKEFADAATSLNSTVSVPSSG